MANYCIHRLTRIHLPLINLQLFDVLPFGGEEVKNVYVAFFPFPKGRILNFEWNSTILKSMVVYITIPSI